MDALPNPDLTDIKLGGKIYQVPPIAWYYLKRIWPLLASKEANPDVTFEQMIDTAILIVATALLPQEPDATPDRIAQVLRFDEAQALLPAIANLLAKSGFGQQMMGEAKAASPSMGTLNGSSPNAAAEESAAVIGNA
jgi:hypothetical protein